VATGADDRRRGARGVRGSGAAAARRRAARPDRRAPARAGDRGAGRGGRRAARSGFRRARAVQSPAGPIMSLIHYALCAVFVVWLVIRLRDRARASRFGRWALLTAGALLVLSPFVWIVPAVFKT